MARFTIDEENHAETFWSACGDVPPELVPEGIRELIMGEPYTDADGQTHYRAVYVVDVLDGEVDAILDWLWSMPGFADGPSHARTAIRLDSSSLVRPDGTETRRYFGPPYDGYPGPECA